MRIFTAEDITNMIMLVSMLDSVEQLGMKSHPQMDYIIAKCKMHVERTERPQGPYTFCPEFEIVFE